MAINVKNTFDLPDRSILRISGSDRHEFLQGQLTQDLASLHSGQNALAGWTTAKGRLLFVCQLMEWNDAVYLPIPADIVQQVANRLTMFVLRAEVQIDSAPDLNLIGLDTNSDGPVTVGDLEVPPDPGACRANDTLCIARVSGDPSRLWVLGTPEAIASIRIPNDVELSAEDWTLRNIQAGIPEIRRETSEMFIPQMLNLDLLGGVSFTKGCYVGQEIVARTQNLGRIKRRMYRFRSKSEHQIASGELLYGPDKLTGKIVSHSHDGHSTELLAVIAIDSAGERWFADEARALPVDLLPLPYSITETE